MLEEERKTTFRELVLEARQRVKGLKLIKPEDKFTFVENVTSKSWLSDGNNPNKALYRKQPGWGFKDLINYTLGRQKFKNAWLCKPNQPELEVIKEIASSEAIRSFLDEFAPKYRLYKQSDSVSVIMSKIIANFTPYEYYRQNSHTFLGNLDISLLDLHLTLIGELKNYDEMLAVCILFGKEDTHGGNWGVVEKDGEKYAATVDHGHAIRGLNFNMRSLMSHCRHHKTNILTHKFADTCLQTAQDFEDNEDIIKGLVVDSINSIQDYIWGFSFNQEQVLQDLVDGCYKLKTIAYQIKAELAILEGDKNALEKVLQEWQNSALERGYNMDITNPPAGCIISTQSDNDFYIPPTRAEIAILNLAENEKALQEELQNWKDYKKRTNITNQSDTELPPAEIENFVDLIRSKFAQDTEMQEVCAQYTLTQAHSGWSR